MRGGGVLSPPLHPSPPPTGAPFQALWIPLGAWERQSLAPDSVDPDGAGSCPDGWGWGWGWVPSYFTDLGVNDLERETSLADAAALTRGPSHVLAPRRPTGLPGKMPMLAVCAALHGSRCGTGRYIPRGSSHLTLCRHGWPMAVVPSHILRLCGATTITYVVDPPPPCCSHRRCCLQRAALSRQRPALSDRPLPPAAMG